MSAGFFHELHRVAAQWLAWLMERAKKPPEDVRRPVPRPLSTPVSNRIFRFVILPALLLCLISKSTQGKDVVYKGRASGHVVESIPLAEPQPNGTPFLFERAEAKGNFTHAGQSRISLEWLVSAEEVDGELFFVIEGTFVMTTARGDRITGQFLALQNASSPESQIEVRVEQGTGRFRNASGTIPGVGLRSGNEFSYELEGQLSL